MSTHQQSVVAQTTVQPVLGHAELMAHIAAAPPEVQAAIAQQLAIATDRSDLAVAAQMTQSLGAQIGTQKLHELGQTVEQQKAAETAVELTAHAQQLAAQGRSETQISGELAGKGASTSVAHSFAQAGVQHQQQTERAEKLATDKAMDEEHRVKVGLAEPTKEAHPFAAIAGLADAAKELHGAVNNYEQGGARRQIDSGKGQGRF